MNNRSVRQRLLAIPLMLDQLKRRADAGAKDSPYSLLLSYGYYESTWFEPEQLNAWLTGDEANSAGNEPLTLSELMTWNSWFALHPEKVCGQQVRVSSRDFPVAIQGSKDDVIRTIRAGMSAKSSDSKTKKMKLMSLKAKAILILQQQEREASRNASDRLGFLGTLKNGRKRKGLSGLDGLGILPAVTSQLITDNAASINAILDKQERGKKYKKGDTLSFKDIVAGYNPGITYDELVAWVWYKRSIGVKMSGWDEYYIKGTVASDQAQVVTKPRATADQTVEIRDNHFRVIGRAEPNTILGTATKKKLRYDRDTTYLIVKLTNKHVDFPVGSLVYVNEADVVVDKPADNVDEAELKRLVEKGCLFYHNGRLMPYPVYAYGNMYDRELQLNADHTIITQKFGESIALAQRQIIQQAKPRIISVQNIDPRERPKILAISDFATGHIIFDLREDAGVDLQKIARSTAESATYRRMSKAEREAMEAMSARKTEAGLFEFSLQDAFRLWLASLPKSDFKEVTAYAITYYYLDNHALSKTLSDQEKDTIGKYAPLEGEELFSRFLNEALLYEDQQKVDFSWNRVFNAYSSIPYHRVPVGFTCSAYFKRSLLQFSPAQREAIAFMEIAGSGCLAYDVGVGKTMSAIITLANSLYAGKCARPLIAVPNPTYAKWLRELVGYEDPATGEFIPGVLSYTGITVNDWSNLGVDVLKKVKLNKAVSEKSITVVTFEGLMKLGYGQKVMDALFEELAKILSQERNNDKSNRDLEKIYQKWRGLVGISNKGSVADIDALGFDYLVIDEAHNFKNIFDQVPTDEDGRKRYKISGSQSDRGIKAFFLANYIQRTFGQNVMLLTATPFTNSPLEIFSMLSLIGYNSLKAMGITSLETFCETFVLQSLEYVNNYKGEIVLDNVVKSYNNRLVLQRLIRNHIAYKTGEEAGVRRPVKINLPRLMAQQADGSFKKLGPTEQIVTYLKPNASQIANQEAIERAANVSGGKAALAAIGRALGQNLDNALSPYLYVENADEAPTYLEFVENSPKIHYAVQCIASVKSWHKQNGSECSGQVIYMNRGKDYFPMVKEYLIKEVGYKLNVKFQNRTFDEVEFITSDVSADRKETIKDAFLAGVVKVIIGTATIKEGIDLQTKGTVLYNLYPDWNPTDIKQLEGRIWRQGNEFGYVRVVMPLVQNTMDVFVFQKLEEKTARINDIWYRADRGNVLDQESLDPMEIKFALYSNVQALVAVKVDQLRREIQRRSAVITGNIEALGKFNLSLTLYMNYQTRCRNWVNISTVWLNRLLDNWQLYQDSNFYDLPIVRNFDARKRVEMHQELTELRQDCVAFQASTELSDKDLIRLLERITKLGEKTQGKAGNYYAIVSDLSEFRQKLSEVRKTERTILTPKGLTIHDDLASLMADYEAEKAAISLESKELNSPENLLRLAEEIQATKARTSIDGGVAEQRADDFARLNYLLSYKAADVPVNAYGLPEQPISKEKQTATPPAGNNAEKAKKIKILKLKARAILILQEQEREQSTESVRRAA